MDHSVLGVVKNGGPFSFLLFPQVHLTLDPVEMCQWSTFFSFYSSMPVAKYNVTELQIVHIICPRILFIYVCVEAILKMNQTCSLKEVQ